MPSGTAIPHESGVQAAYTAPILQSIMRLTTLGGVDLEGSRSRRIKPLLLLAYLAIEGPKERLHLAELFWMNASDPFNSLSTALSQLRTEAPGSFRADHIQVETAIPVDATELLTCIDTGDLEEAVELYRGPFLRGVYLKDWSAELEEWMYGTREFIAGRVQEAHIKLAERDAASGEFEGAARRAETAYLLPGALEPASERLERLYTLMVAGGSARAQDVAGEAESFGPALNLTPEQAREQLAQAAPPEAMTHHNLPAQPTTFVGRTEEKQQLAELLQDSDTRLISITGPGGMGKTRLAIEVAGSKLGRFADGVFFVPFSAVASPDGMIFAIRDALDLPDSGRADPKEHLFEYLADKAMLLVLDNLEHLIEGADIVGELWERAPGLKLLVTSRERLNLQAEQVLSLSGLSTPGDVPVDHSDAVALFVSRAWSSGVPIALNDETTEAIARVCALVGGLPLAIELAASWARVLPIDEIAVEVERGIDLLEGSARDVPERHRSARAVFDHSWELLTQREKEAIRKLAVFRGGFRREAAAVVVGATLPLLAGMVDKSLLRLNPGGRFDRHPLLYQYTRDKLLERPEEKAVAEARHGRYYLEKVIEPGGTPEALKDEPANIQAAWDWAVTNRDLELIEQAAWPLTSAFEGHDREAIALFTEAAENLDENDPVHMKALANVMFGEAYHHCLLGNYSRMDALAERGLELARAAGDKTGIMRGVVLLIDYGSDSVEVLRKCLVLAREVGSPRDVGQILTRILLRERNWADLPEFRRRATEILTELRESGDERHVAFGLVVAGAGLVYRDALDEGQALLEEGLGRSLELGLRADIPTIQCELGLVAYKRGRLDEARSLYLEAGEGAREIDQQRFVAKALAGVGRVALARGDLREAKRHLQRSLETFWSMKDSDDGFMYETLVVLGELLCGLGKGVQAAELLFMVKDGSYVEKRDRDQAERQLERLREQLPPEELAAAQGRAKSVKLEEVVQDLLGSAPEMEVTDGKG